MSTSSTDVTLSVVVGSNGAPGSIETFLETLGPQLDDEVEVLVCESAASPDEVRLRFPHVRFLERPGRPRARAVAGRHRRGRGEVVLLTISPMLPAPDWIATVRRLSPEADAVGGAIDPAAGLRVRDWAEYFCRYARDMRPFEPHACADLPGDNAAYAMAALAPIREAYRYWLLGTGRASCASRPLAPASSRPVPRRLPGAIGRHRGVRTPALAARAPLRSPARVRVRPHPQCARRRRGAARPVPDDVSRHPTGNGEAEAWSCSAAGAPADLLLQRRVGVRRGTRAPGGTHAA